MRLEKKDAAVIFKPDSKIELALPKFKDSDMVTSEMLYATAVATLLEENDKDFYKILEKKIKQIIKEVNNNEAEL